MSLNGLSTTLLTNEQILANSTSDDEELPVRPLDRTTPLAGSSFSAVSLSATSPNIVLINDEAVEITATGLLTGQSVAVLVFTDGRPTPHEAKAGVELVLTLSSAKAMIGANGHYRLVMSSDAMIGVTLVNRTIKTQVEYTAWLATL